nr:helix-turn-helix domain-containing protein [Paraburkholderia sacchari]
MSKLTQADVAQRVGLGQNRISHLERNPDELSFKQLLSWCSAIGLELRLGERDADESKNVLEW